MTQSKENARLEKAQKLQQKKRKAECYQLCRSIIRSNPSCSRAHEILALCALESQDFVLAVESAGTVSQLEPNNINGALIRSVALMHQSRDHEVIAVLEDQLARTPDAPALLFNLFSALSNVGNNRRAIEVALKSVELEPTNSDAYNNLGSSLFAIGRSADAAVAFQTAVDLNPNNLTARLNLAHSLGSDEEKVRAIDEALERFGPVMSDRVRISAIHNTAFPYLRLGQLEKGWERLESGFSPLIDSNRGRRPQRTFSAPRWSGEPLKGRRLLVWREQGLGDEIMFGSVLPELLDIDGTVILECEPRLVSLMSRSFPGFEVRSEYYRATYPFDTPNSDFDLQIPIGSLCGIFRRNITDFERSRSYLAPDVSLLDLWKSRLNTLDGGGAAKHINVGICWRSGVVSPTRGPSYTRLEDWNELFSIPNCQVVNLQYGSASEEINHFCQTQGARILEWDDLDLQNDIDSLAALIRSLDLVISVGTVVAQLGGAVGTQTFLCANQFNWTSFSTDKFMFFPDITLVVTDAGDTTDSVRQVIRSLKETLT